MVAMAFIKEKGLLEQNTVSFSTCDIDITGVFCLSFDAFVVSNLRIFMQYLAIGGQPQRSIIFDETQGRLADKLIYIYTSI